MKKLYLVAFAGLLIANTASADEIGVFRNGKWIMDTNNDKKTKDDPRHTFGVAGDAPLAGRCGSNGTAKIFAVRGNNWFYSFNDFAWNSGDGSFVFGSNPEPLMHDGNIAAFVNGTFYYDDDGSRSWTSGDSFSSFGVAGDLPISVELGLEHCVSGELNFCTAVPSIGIFRSVGSNGYFALDNDGSGTWTQGDEWFQFGAAGDIPVVVDNHIGTFRNGYWFIDTNDNHVWDVNDTTWKYGKAGDVPVVAQNQYGWTCPVVR